MNIADRIQHLRKTRGISQEELADKIGVSRQAVSKWESEQSLPDLEKIILLSDFFEVTTDYLLKGVEAVPAREDAEQEPDAGIFATVGTAFNLIGLIIAAMVWYEEQTATASAIGLICMVLGCMIYGIGMKVSKPETRAKAKGKFYSLNLWILAFIPLSMLYNILTGCFHTAPYPVLEGSPVMYILFWITYIAVCRTGNFIISKKQL